MRHAYLKCLEREPKTHKRETERMNMNDYEMLFEVEQMRREREKDQWRLGSCIGSNRAYMRWRQHGWRDHHRRRSASQPDSACTSTFSTFLWLLVSCLDSARFSLTYIAEARDYRERERRPDLKKDESRISCSRAYAWCRSKRRD